MLSRLSAQEHRVLTAVHLCSEGFDAGELCETRVHFRALSAAEIERYVAGGEALDKAGGYGIQGRAGVFVSHIAGSYSGVVGLPLFETARLFRQAGLMDL
jgi:septum formation protein